jgi:hypothetical protein
MRIGIVLRGVSYGKSANGNVDWRIVKDNIKEFLIDSFPGHEVLVYFTTYNNETLDELIDFYNPRKTLLLPSEGSHQRITLLESCQFIQNEPLDFIINTRFDIRWFQKVGQLNLDVNKFNFLYKEVEPEWTNNRFVSDIIFGFPRPFLEHFMQAIVNEHQRPSRPYPMTDFHNSYVRMVEVLGDDKIHFIHDAPHPEPHTRTPENPPGDNLFYRIIRG